MSAAGAVVCPACRGLMNAGDGMCGACWARLTLPQQERARQSREHLAAAVATVQQIRRVGVPAGVERGRRRWR